MTSNPPESATPSQDGEPVDLDKHVSGIPLQTPSTFEPAARMFGPSTDEPPGPAADASPTPPPAEPVQPQLGAPTNWQPSAHGRPPYAPPSYPAYPLPPYPQYQPAAPPKSRKGLLAVIFGSVGLILAVAAVVAIVAVTGDSGGPSTAQRWHTWLESGGRSALSRYTSDYATWNNAEYCATTKAVDQSIVDDTQAVMAVTSPLPETVSAPLQSWANHTRTAAQADIAYCSVSSGSSAESEAETTFDSERSAANESMTELRSALRAAGVPETDIDVLPSSGNGGTA